MSGFKDTVRAAGTTAAVVAGAAMGQGPSNADALKAAQQQQKNQSSAQIQQATRNAGQPKTGQR